MTNGGCGWWIIDWSVAVVPQVNHANGSSLAENFAGASNAPTRSADCNETDLSESFTLPVRSQTLAKAASRPPFAVPTPVVTTAGVGIAGSGQRRHGASPLATTATSAGEAISGVGLGGVVLSSGATRLPGSRSSSASASAATPTPTSTSTSTTPFAPSASVSPVPAIADVESAQSVAPSVGPVVVHAVPAMAFSPVMEDSELSDEESSVRSTPLVGRESTVRHHPSDGQGNGSSPTTVGGAAMSAEPVLAHVQPPATLMTTTLHSPLLSPTVTVHLLSPDAVGVDAAAAAAHGKGKVGSLRASGSTRPRGISLIQPRARGDGVGRGEADDSTVRVLMGTAPGRWVSWWF